MRSGSRQRRVLLLFFLGIVLPSLLLGYLAFRGIKNDQALLDKSRIDDQRRTAELITRTVTSSITATEQAFLEAVPARQDSADPALPQRLEAFTRTHPLVEAVFLSQDADTVRFPAVTLLYLSPG